MPRRLNYRLLIPVILIVASATVELARERVRHGAHLLFVDLPPRA